MKAEWFRTYAIFGLKLPTGLTQVLEICVTQILWNPSSKECDEALTLGRYTHGIVNRPMYPMSALQIKSKSGVDVELFRREGLACHVKVFGFPKNLRPSYDQCFYMEQSNAVATSIYTEIASIHIDRFTFILLVSELLAMREPGRQSLWIRDHFC